MRLQFLQESAIQHMPTGDLQRLFCFSLSSNTYSKTCVKRSLSKRQKIGFQDQLSLYEGRKFCRMEHSAILSTFIKLPFVIKIFVLSIFLVAILHRCSPAPVLGFKTQSCSKVQVLYFFFGSAHGVLS